MRKKNLWRKVMVVSMCSAMIFATPVVQASDVDAVAEETIETAEEAVAPTVTCDQTVLNGKDDITLHFDLGSASKVTSAHIWLNNFDGELEPVYNLLESGNFYVVDYANGVVTFNSRAVCDYLYNDGGASVGDLNGIKIGLGLTFDDGSELLGGELTIQDGEQTTPDGGQTTPDGNTDNQTPDGGQTTPDGNTDAGQTTPDGQTPDAGQTTPDAGTDSQTQKLDVKPVAPSTTQTQPQIENTSTNPKTGDVAGFAGVMVTALSSFGVATATLLRKCRRK